MAQRGGFVIGVVVGLLVGLALALGVALYITKAPMPFVNKVPLRTAAQDTAETERNSRWDPNASLGAHPVQRGASSAVAAASAASQTFGPPEVPPLLPPPASERPSARPTSAPAPVPAPVNGVAGTAPDPFVYFVQAGAFTRNEDAEQQRARLALAGQSARITEREQSGRTVYRVRLGPFSARDAADGLQERLQDQGIDSQIVRVEKP